MRWPRDQGKSKQLAGFKKKTQEPRDLVKGKRGLYKMNSENVYLAFIM